MTNDLRNHFAVSSSYYPVGKITKKSVCRSVFL